MPSQSDLEKLFFLDDEDRRLAGLRRPGGGAAAASRLELVATTSDDSVLACLRRARSHWAARRDFIPLPPAAGGEDDAGIAFASANWRAAITDRRHPGMVARRHFEAMVFTYLAEELRTGDIAVAGAGEYADWLLARFFGHLGAGFPGGTQCLPLAGRAGAELPEFGGMRSDHLGQTAGRTGEPGKDLVAFPPGVSALLPGLAGGVFPGPCGFCPRIIGAGAGGRGALAGLPGLREGLVACAAGSADLCPGPGSRPGDRLLRSLPGLRDTVSAALTAASASAWARRIASPASARACRMDTSARSRAAVMAWPASCRIACRASSCPVIRSRSPALAELASARAASASPWAASAWLAISSAICRASPARPRR